MVLKKLTLPTLSLEQREKLNQFCITIKKWNGLNLISKNTCEDIWHFHINDALAIYSLLKNERLPIVDFGAGNGILSFVLKTLNIEITCIERSQNKKLFIESVANLNCQNEIQFKQFVAVVKGVDKIKNLLPLLSGAKRIILFKSSNYMQEINEAKESFKFAYTVFERPLEGVIIELIL